MKVIDTKQLQASAKEVEIQDELFFDLKAEEEFDLNDKIRSIFDIGDVVSITVKRVIKDEGDK